MHCCLGRKQIKLFALSLLSAALLFAPACQSREVQAEPDAAVGAMPSASSKVLLVTDEYKPYTSQNLPDHGFMSVLVCAAAQQAGIDAEVQFFPWTRCQQLVLQAQAWAAFPYSHSEINDRQYWYSDPVYRSRYQFYYMKSNPSVTQDALSYSKISDFTKYTFGGTNGYWYGGPEKFAEAGVKVEWANDTDALVKMLHAGRIDFIVEDDLVARETFQRLFPSDADQFVALPKDASIRDYHLIVSKTYPGSAQLMERFNAALAQLRQSGEYDRILKEHDIAQP